ncbi:MULTISPECIES: hypothetical protein [Rhizobium/Agrobacterium group]|uniref:hypothetical protein n=1 Tax=Rhizobium/Agrobacterium group TaxID=227290 RepID=UPI001CD99C30|nr:MULTISPECIES: hypothetical protein [Rhizobium/Agrobacterium group]MCZ7453590.1 hypothetical protein [Rhizobium rhizogenes]
MTALQHIMRLHAVLAGDETDATAAFFKSRIVKAEFLLRHAQGTLLSLRISRGITLFFPKPGASAGTLRAEPQATWLLLFFCLSAFNGANGRFAAGKRRGGNGRFFANNDRRRSHRVPWWPAFPAVRHTELRQYYLHNIS